MARQRGYMVEQLPFVPGYEVAGFPAVGLTAYNLLADVARLRPGESVLIQAAAGGVGMVAVQIARHLGAGQIIETTLTTWTVADLTQTSRRIRDGKMYVVSRQWTIRRILSHDLHHSGELALLLGLQGIDIPDLGERGAISPNCLWPIQREVDAQHGAPKAAPLPLLSAAPLSPVRSSLSANSPPFSQRVSAKDVSQALSQYELLALSSPFSQRNLNGCLFLWLRHAPLPFPFGIHAMWQG